MTGFLAEVNSGPSIPVACGRTSSPRSVPDATVRNVSIVIPAFNEAPTVGEVVRGLQSIPAVQEIIVVDDGSSDGTKARAEAAGARVIAHRFRRGYGAALKTGIRAARGRYVVFVDGDGQHRPDDVRQIIRHLPEAAMVVGVRPGNAGAPWRRAPGKRFIRWLVSRLARHPVPDVTCGLRGAERSLLVSILPLMPNSFSFSTTSTLAVLHEGHAIHFVPIEVRPRQGRSSVSLIRDGFGTILLVVRLISLFAPLRVFVPIAGLCLLGGAASFCLDLLVFRNLNDATLMLVLAGLMIFFYGVLADQVAAIRREVMRGPPP